MSLVDDLLQPFMPRRRRRRESGTVSRRSDTNSIRYQTLSARVQMETQRLMMMQQSLSQYESMLEQMEAQLPGRASPSYLESQRARLWHQRDEMRRVHDELRRLITERDMAAFNMDLTQGTTTEAFTPDQAVASGSVEPKKRRGRPRKIDVAEAVAEYTEQKAEAVKNKMSNQDKDIEQLEQSVNEANKRLVTIKKNRELLAEKYDALTQKKRSELVSEYRKVITKLKMNPMIDGFRVDQDKRVIVRTAPLKIKKDRWRREKTAGVYEIRIDFSKQSFDQGIEVLNLTQRCDNYDSPTVNDTKPCWGNIFGDIEVDFNTQDIYELVMDMIDYISSPYDGDGYLNNGKEYDDDRDKGGWDQFFKKAKPQPENYSFEKYDQDNEAKQREIMRDMPQPSDPHMQLEYNQIASTAMAYTTMTVPQTTTISGQVDTRSAYAYELQRCLDELGFNDRGARYFSQLITEEEDRPEPRTVEEEERRRAERMEIANLDLRKRGDEVHLYVMRVRPMQVSVSEDPSPAEMAVENPRRIDRYFANPQDIKEAILEELNNNGVRSYRVDSSRFRQPRWYAFQDLAVMGGGGGGSSVYGGGAVGGHGQAQDAYGGMVRVEPDGSWAVEQPQTMTATEHMARVRNARRIESDSDLSSPLQAAANNMIERMDEALRGPDRAVNTTAREAGIESLTESRLRDAVRGITREDF